MMERVVGWCVPDQYCFHRHYKSSYVSYSSSALYSGTGLVGLVDTMESQQQRRELSEPANAHARFLFAIPPFLLHDDHLGR